MVYCKCSNCGVYLEVDENDYMPGCRETEDVTCPKCGKVVTTVFTSGFPSATEISKEDYDKVVKFFD